MNTLIAVSISPVGHGEELSREVAEVIRIIRKSHLPNQTYSMFTEIEGSWDEVMLLVKEATEVLTNRGIRTIVNLTADVRPGYVNTMQEKVTKVNQLLQN